MNLAEIIIRTEDQSDAILIANAVSNGLERVGFDNVTTSIIGATEHTDPELMQAISNINPELGQIAVDISFEQLPASGGVDESSSLPSDADEVDDDSSEEIESDQD